MEVHWGEWRYSSTHSLTSALDGGEWTTSRRGRFTSREIAPGTHWIRGWVGSKAGLDRMVNGEFPAPAGTQTPDHLTYSPALYRFEGRPDTSGLSSVLLANTWIPSHFLSTKHSRSSFLPIHDTQMGET
jgi:hypothetical protein